MTNLHKLKTLDIDSDEYDDLYIELIEKLENLLVTEFTTIDKMNNMNEEQLKEENKLIADFLRMFADRLE
jgi:hypothetical protein